MCRYYYRDQAGLLPEATFEVSYVCIGNLLQLMSSQMLRYGCTRLEIGVQSVYEVSYCACT
jgi:hypothetical protein